MCFRVRFRFYARRYISMTMWTDHVLTFLAEGRRRYNMYRFCGHINTIKLQKVLISHDYRYTQILYVHMYIFTLSIII